MAKHFLNRKKKKQTPNAGMPKTAKTIKMETYPVPLATFEAQYKQANPDVLVLHVDPGGPPVEVKEESTGRVFLVKEGRIFVKGCGEEDRFIEYID